MNRSSFVRAVAPALLAEAAFSLTHSFFGAEGDLSLLDWFLVGVSFIAFPVWAGIRVARAGGSRRWSAIGGACVTFGMILGGALSELFVSSPADAAAWEWVFFGLLLFIPLQALLGYLGGLRVRSKVHIT